MPTDCITYQDSGYFSPMITDYLDEKPTLANWYHRFPTLENFKEQLTEKRASFDNSTRQILVEELQRQYAHCPISEATAANLKALRNPNTFTITTGHQLNLFTGPLYFLYKIVSVINLCKSLKKAYPEAEFVPVYWMATEDHDFEEINYFNLNGTKIQWQTQSTGPVGRLSTAGLETVYDTFARLIGNSQNAAYLKDLFQKAYLEHSNLAEATRFLANELFKNEGLVIIDGDSAALKNLFIPYVKEELLHQTSYKKVSQTKAALTDYKIQVNPREINLFYIEDQLRERLVFENGKYAINNTSRTFTEAEILSELEQHPEKFSPNVILRPLYQEVILPNLAYIGGGGELAYWLELKANFEAHKLPFPILVLRNSVLLATQKQAEKADHLNLTWKDLFMPQQELITTKTKSFSQFEIDFSAQKNHLKQQFESLYQVAEKTDRSFSGAVKAQEAKQIKGLEKLEKRLLKAEKRIHTDKIDRILHLQNELFPGQGLQERKDNFAGFYEAYGPDLLSRLLENLQPLEQQFTTVVL